MTIETGSSPGFSLFAFRFPFDDKIQSAALQFLTVVANTRYKGCEQDPLFPCLGRSFSSFSS